MSKTTHNVTAKNFNTKLASVIKSATTQRDTIQALVVFAAEHYSGTDKNGDRIADAVYFTKLLKETVAVRSLATKTLQAYIEAHTNLSWTAPKDGEPAFRKVAKSEFKCDMDAIASTVWYLHDNASQAKPYFKAADYAKRVLAKLEKEGLPAAEFIKLLQTQAKAK